jgi:short-subunit dehydrogenase
MVVVITGASSGIGRALAVVLSGHGAKLVLSARRLARLEELNREIGGAHICVQTDVSSERACTELIAHAHRHFGRIDTLVCNAGYGLIKPVAETTADELRGIMATNLAGSLDCIRPTVPLMRAQAERDGYRGQIMLVSSIVARRSIPMLGAYAATKAAQLSLAEALRVECAVDRIAVSSVHPIGTESEFSQSAVAGAEVARPSTMQLRKQTSEHVATVLARAIRRPRPEVWPSRPSRLAASLGTAMPRLIDWLLARHLAQHRERSGHKPG